MHGGLMSLQLMHTSHLLELLAIIRMFACADEAPLDSLWIAVAGSSSPDLDSTEAGKGLLGSMKRLHGKQTADSSVLSRLLNAELPGSCSAFPSFILAPTI